MEGKTWSNPNTKNKPSQVGAIEYTRFPCIYSEITGGVCVHQWQGLILPRPICFQMHLAIQQLSISFLRCDLYSWQSRSLRLIWGMLFFHANKSERARGANHAQHADSWFFSFFHSLLSIFFPVFLSFCLTFILVSFFIPFLCLLPTFFLIAAVTTTTEFKECWGESSCVEAEGCLAMARHLESNSDLPFKL